MPVSFCQNVHLLGSDAPVPGHPHITNQTACIDGYINGWRDWCNSDEKWCAFLVTKDIFPGIIFNATTANTFEPYASGYSAPPPTTNASGNLTETQIAKAETNCSRTDLTQAERYTCGYNHGYLDAQTDWNLNRGEDNSCPHATEHTLEYCNGYAKGYTYEWNTLISTTESQSQSQPPSIQTQPQNTTTPTGPTYENTTYGIRVQNQLEPLPQLVYLSSR
jgi:hypothetical protein